MKSKNILLASASPYRQALLNRLGLKFKIEVSGADENEVPGETALNMALRLSILKAETVNMRVNNSLVIGSDQVAECEEKILQKPVSAEQAKKQLFFLSGKIVDFHTGVCLLNGETGKIQAQVITTRVEYRTLSAASIANFLAVEPAFDCVGSAKIEGYGITLVKKVICDDPTALIGLPLITLCEMLHQENVTIP